MGGIMITLMHYMPMTWLIISILLGVFEAMTVDLVAIWFAIGALAAILPAAIGAPFWVQLVVFLAVGLLTLALTRPMVKRVLHVKKTNTNADRVIGMVGIVTVPIDNVAGTGRVLANGLDWAARTDDGAPVEAQERVLIKAIEGVTLIVERVG